MANAPSLLEELAELWDAGAAVIEVITVEEPRALELGQKLAARVGARFAYWSMHRGLDGIDANARDPIAALDAIARHPGPTVAVMLDLHESLKTHPVARRLRDLVAWYAANDRCLLLVSAQGGLPRGLSEDAARVDIGPPDERELAAHFDQIAADTVPERKVDAASRHRLVRAALGLTTAHARRAFARALARDPMAGASALSVVALEKKRLFAQDLGLDFIEAPETLDALGGLESFKQWLIERQSALGPTASTYGLSSPRGVLLLGVQGCGKSLAAKCAASFLGLPLVRLDLPRVMGSGAGGATAEESLRRALDAAEQSAPMALWVDEIEKAFAGSGAKGTDSRAARLLGAFSTWLQERSRPVFVVATANDVSQLPPELLRRGRFDELFFVDLPDLEAREGILALHLQRRGKAMSPDALRAVAEQCLHFSGAELEQVVLASLQRAFSLGREVNEGDLRRSARELVPLYRTYEEQIKQLREWSRGRARLAGREGTLLDLFRRAPTSGDGAPS
ncbi:MAG: AAA family ATPase [Polyangiales bacterium]